MSVQRYNPNDELPEIEGVVTGVVEQRGATGLIIGHFTIKRDGGVIEGTAEHGTDRFALAVLRTTFRDEHGQEKQHIGVHPVREPMPLWAGVFIKGVINAMLLDYCGRLRRSASVCSNGDAMGEGEFIIGDAGNHKNAKGSIL